MDNHNIPKGFYTVSSDTHNLLTGPHPTIDEALKTRQRGDNSCVLYNDEPLIGWGPWESASPIVDEKEVKLYQDELQKAKGDDEIAEEAVSNKLEESIDP